MKVFAVAFFIGFIALSQCMDDELAEKMKQFETECIAESGIDKDLAMKAEQGHFEDDGKSKAYFFCFMKKAGFIDDAGEYQVDMIKQTITKKYDEATAEKYVSECLKETQGNPEENALHMVKCYHEHVMKDKH